MDSELQDMFIDVFFLKLCKMYTQLHKNKRTRRRWKTRPINTDYQTAGYHRKVFLKIKEENHEEFFKQTRMTKSVYDLLISLIGKGLVKKRQKIDPEERLAITLQ